MLWWPSWLPRTHLRKLELRYRANFLMSLRIVRRRLSNESGKCLKSYSFLICFLLLVSVLKDPFANRVLRPRPVQNDGYISRCIPCSIPDSTRGETNYMLCNGYNIWCRSRTLCSCLRRKSVWYVTVDGDHDCSFMFLLLVICHSSIACYQSHQRAFCANNCLHNNWGRANPSCFWSGIYGWYGRYWCKNWCRDCSYWAARWWNWS